jgi:hypothetical protein
MNDLLTTAEQYAKTYATDIAGKVASAPVVAAVTAAATGAVQKKTISLADFLAVAVLIANAYLATSKTK